MTYKISLDSFAKVTTIAVTVLFTAIIVTHILIFREIGSVSAISIVVLFVLLYFVAFLYRPVSYSLTADYLIIHRLITDIKINRKEIKSIERINRSDLKWTMRIFGSGGLWGYWGRFANKKIGNMTWYATRRNNTVLVTTIYNKNIILTPNEPEKIVTDFYENLT